MTDFQLKALMSMVLDIVDKSSDKEEIKRAIKKLVTGKLDEGFTDEE